MRPGSWLEWTQIGCSMSVIRKQRQGEKFAAEVRRQIQDRLLEPGHYLLPERELARKYRVSLRAVREGLAVLVEEKLIRRNPRSGTVVLSSVKPAPRSRTPRNIAWVIPGRVRDTSGAEMCDALQQGFQAHGYGTVLYSSDNIAEKETQILRQLVRDRVPGAVLFSAHPCTSFEHLAEARAAEMKLVLVDHDFPGFDCDSVHIDDELGAYEATEHLIRLGCAQLVHLTSEANWTSCRLRQKGFGAAANRFGRSREASVIRLPRCQTTAQTREMLGRRLAESLTTGPRPAGVLAVNDGLALAVMDILREQGTEVPREVAVIGFNNDVEGALAEIPLTTVEIPREEIARQAVQLMMEQLEGRRRESKQVRLKPRLILRQSCGCYQTRAVSAAEEATR